MSKKGREFDHSHYQTWVDPNELIPYPKNAKQHDKAQVKNIANSIRRFGWQQEAVVTQDNVLVIGHGRRLAALMLKCEMPVKVIDQKAEDLTDEDIRELRIADNKTNESPWDFELLTDEIDDLTFDGFDFDFDLPEEGDASLGDEAKGRLAETYLVPPFSVIYANKPDWLARKRAWVDRGLRSELGRGGTCLQYKEQSRGKLHTGGAQPGAKQSLQEQQRAQQLSKKSKAYADGLIEKREMVRKYGRTV